jgi:hypothetical protein
LDQMAHRPVDRKIVTQRRSRPPNACLSSEGPPGLQSCEFCNRRFRTTKPVGAVQIAAHSLSYSQPWDGLILTTANEEEVFP